MEAGVSPTRNRGQKKKKETGDKKGFHAQEPHRVLLGFTPPPAPAGVSWHSKMLTESPENQRSVSTLQFTTIATVPERGNSWESPHYP